MSKQLTIISSLSLVVILALLLWWATGKRQSLASYAPSQVTDAAEISTLVESLWQAKKLPDSVLAKQLLQSEGPVYVAARRHGKRQAHAWVAEGTVLDSLRLAIEQIRKDIADSRVVDDIDTLEVVFTYDYKPVAYRKRFSLGNIHRGIRGLQIQFEGKTERYSPTYMLSTNLSFSKLIQGFLSKEKLLRTERARQIILHDFAADPWLVSLEVEDGRSVSAVRMERGNVYVPIESVQKPNVARLGELATEWLATNLQANGRMTYKYWPSIRQESTGNNMIRQWMATVALVRAARFSQDKALMSRAAENIQYNLDNFYRMDGDYGLIEFGGKVKLGAVALAALAIAEHTGRSQWRKEELALQKTIDFLWQEDGSFRTFYKPAARNDVQNFYPGEALLYLSTLFAENRDEVLLNKIMQSFRYYRDWHLTPANRNPAFIPWHTQAYYKVWEITGDKELQAFVFTMNDWLIAEMQQWQGDVKYRDALGRFYNPRKPYGPPHVSSTGVYMEGLIDAFRMARSVNDAERETAYRTAIQRGLRSVMQLQFVDEVDMYYVPETIRDRVRGGMRTTLYNNEIRCDNVQHNLMAILKILEGFGPGDYVGTSSAHES